MKGARLIAVLCAVLGAWTGAHAETEAQRKQREWAERLAAFFRQAGDGVDQKAVAAQAAKIAKLQDALRKCGDCAEKETLTAMLSAVRGTPGGTWPEPVDEPDQIPEHEVIATMRAKGVAEDCIAFYRQYARCSRAAKDRFSAARGPCADEFRLYQYCADGNAKGFAEASARWKGRAEGALIPRIEADAVHFGKVPGDFNPPVPPPSYLEGRWHLALIMRKDEEGALVQVWLKPLAEYLHEFLLLGRGERRRREVKQESLDKIDAMSRAAAEIKNAYVIECGYTLGNGDMRVSSFWWDKRPDAPMATLRVIESGGRAIARYGTMLETVVPIGGARTRCPDEW